MNRRSALENIRWRLWDRFINTQNNGDLTFDQLWYELLTRQFLSDSPIEIVFEEVCNELEKGLVKTPDMEEGYGD